MNMHPKPFPKALFITGIGTDVGKSYATGWLAKEIAATGKSVITQKLIQTGNRDVSEDIEIHRRIMGIPMQSVDLCRVTAPIILSYPASPHLAAKIDGIELDYGVASAATDTLLNKYDHVLIEGAGGLMVPLKERYLTIDYITGHKLPTVVVTNGRLGSISDTLLTLLPPPEPTYSRSYTILISTRTKPSQTKHSAISPPTCKKNSQIHFS